MTTDLIRSILNGVPMPLLLIDRLERVGAANRAAEAIFGPVIEGRHYLTVMRQPVLLDAIEGTLRHHQPSETRLSIQAASRETTWRARVAPVDAGPEVGPGVLVSLEDITDVEHAGQMRRDFVANVSHELRTPLTALLGFIETLKGAARDDARARDRFLGIMEAEAARMNRLISDLLSLSRVEAEERVRPGERVDIAALLQASVTSLRAVAEAQGVAIEVSGADQPVPLLADPDQMRQVFNNLIENAVKYGGSRGRISVTLSREARDLALRGPAVRIDVTDYGDGIDAIHIPRLTERFYRVDSHRSREKGGTGLGLAIVKHIVNRHRGRFRIESEKGKGSRFSVFLPET